MKLLPRRTVVLTNHVGLTEELRKKRLTHPKLITTRKLEIMKK